MACVREWVANIFFYRKGDTTIMIDAGYNYDRLEEKMGWLGIDPKSIDKILMKPEYYDALINGVMKNNFRRCRWITATGIPRTSGTPSSHAGLKSPLRSRSRHPRKRILNPSAMLPTAAMTAYNSPMTR